MQRSVLRKVAAASAGAVISGIASAANARLCAPYRPRLEKLEIARSGDGPTHSPIRIGFATDLHIGPAFSAIDAAPALERLAAEQPDVMLLGGDLICESPRYIAQAVSVIGEFLTSAPLGAFAVLGNHDYSNDACQLASRLEDTGVRVLRNEATRLVHAADTFWIVGIDDALLGQPDVDRAFSGIPADELAVALWHEPDWAEESAARGAALQLSGHSHGGQVRLPGLGHLAAPTGGRRYVNGLNDAHGMPVYTSRGLGVYRPPVRFLCSPEVTLVTIA